MCTSYYIILYYISIVIIIIIIYIYILTSYYKVAFWWILMKACGRKGNFRVSFQRFSAGQKRCFGVLQREF